MLLQDDWRGPRGVDMLVAVQLLVERGEGVHSSSTFEAGCIQATKCTCEWMLGFSAVLVRVFLLLQTSRTLQECCCCPPVPVPAAGSDVLELLANAWLQPMGTFWD
jgi:hypothetical protein